MPGEGAVAVEADVDSPAIGGDVHVLQAGPLIERRPANGYPRPVGERVEHVDTAQEIERPDHGNGSVA